MLQLLRERLNVRYAVVLAAVGAFLWLTFRDELMGPVLEPLRTLITQATLGLIHAVGMQATREASAIYHPGGFAYEISRGCTGFVPAAMLLAAISAYPAERRHKVVGLALGVPALLGINLVRLVHLFYVGVHQPEWFHAAHKIAWEGLIILAIVGIWLGWATWVARGTAGRRRSVTRPWVGSRTEVESCASTSPYWCSTSLATTGRRPSGTP